MMVKSVILVFIGMLICSIEMLVCDAASAFESVDPVFVQDDEPIVCHPEGLTDEDKEMEMPAPCAPKNYIYLPHVGGKRRQDHDENGIWSDEEVKFSVIDPSKGAVIWESTAKVGETEVTVSAIGVGLCASPSKCPARVRFRTPGKPDKIVDIGQVCGTGVNFIRNDLKYLLTCEKHYPMNGKE